MDALALWVRRLYPHVEAALQEATFFVSDSAPLATPNRGDAIFSGTALWRLIVSAPLAEGKTNPGRATVCFRLEPASPHDFHFSAEIKDAGQTVASAPALRLTADFPEDASLLQQVTYMWNELRPQFKDLATRQHREALAVDPVQDRPYREAVPERLKLWHRKLYPLVAPLLQDGLLHGLEALPDLPIGRQDGLTGSFASWILHMSPPAWRDREPTDEITVGVGFQSNAPTEGWKLTCDAYPSDDYHTLIVPESPPTDLTAIQDFIETSWSACLPAFLALATEGPEG